VLAILGAAAFVYLGLFDVSATAPHWPVTHWVLETARIRSIQVHAADLSAPVGYDEEPKLVMAVGHFSEHCTLCHGGPGAKRNEAVEGMYPQPPDLKNVTDRYTPGELFWILKNGIKMSGMPSMASDGDDMLWATVALLQKLPSMSDDDYNALWLSFQAAAEQGGMDHGAMHMDGMKMGSNATTGQSAPAASSPPAAPAASLPLVSGRVEDIDTAGGKVTLDHGPIPNLNMDGMTMAWKVADPAMLKDLKKGEKVQFSADRVNGSLTVTHIQGAK
jgi:Cu/Ag efflux protein CusF